MAKSGALLLLVSSVCLADAQENWLAARRTTFATWRATPVKTATERWDRPESPRLMVIPAGQFTMGSPEGEAGRQAYEGPGHLVTIARPFALGIMDVTRGEFAQFVAQTHYDAKGTGCYVKAGDSFARDAAANWENPGFAQSDSDPVVCVNWNDANAYAQWLRRITGGHYRLPSEAEWEYAARAGSAKAYYWGEALGQGQANCADCGSPYGYQRTSPGGSFPANPFGLYDMSGNVWQWTADCWNPGYDGAPADGTPRMAGTCDYRVLRGGSWFSHGRAVRLANRYDKYIVAADRNAIHGFRVAKSLCQKLTKSNS
jgi:formylglycine-generating enzyme required for sulfatase activity